MRTCAGRTAFSFSPKSKAFEQQVSGSLSADSPLTPCSTDLPKTPTSEALPGWGFWVAKRAVNPRRQESKKKGRETEGGFFEKLSYRSCSSTALDIEGPVEAMAVWQPQWKQNATGTGAGIGLTRQQPCV